MLLPSQPHLPPPPPPRSPVSLPWERRCEHRGGAHQGAWFVHPAAPLQLSPWQLRTQSARVRVLYSKGTDSRRKAEFGGGGEKKKSTLRGSGTVSGWEPGTASLRLALGALMGLRSLVWLLTVAESLLFLSVTDALGIAGWRSAPVL